MQFFYIGRVGSPLRMGAVMGQCLRVRTATMAPPLAQCMSGFVFGSGFRSFFAIFELNKDTQNTQTHRKPKYLDWNDQKYILTEVSFRSLGKESVLFVHCPLLSSLFHMHSGRRRLTKISDWNSQEAWGIKVLKMSSQDFWLLFLLILIKMNLWIPKRKKSTDSHPFL